MRVSRLICALLISCMLVSNSEASVLGDMLTFDGIVDLANDNSDGVFTDTDGDGVTDLVQGIVWIDSVNGKNVAVETGGSIFAVYSFTVTPTGAGLPGTTQFSSVATPAGPNSATSMISGANFALTTYNAAVGEPAIIIFETLGSFTNVDWENLNPAGSPLGIDLHFTPTGGVLTGFDVDITAGFVPGSDDSHTINIFVPSVPIGDFAGVYSIKEHIFGGITYIPETSPAVPFLHPGGMGDIVIDDGSIGSAVATGASGRNFNFSDAGTYRLNPTPEPAALLVWAGLIGAASLVAARRLKK